MANRWFLFLILLFPLQLVAQNTISGKVYDLENKKMPLQGVKVRNLKSNQAVATQALGAFTLTAQLGDLLEFSFAGYHTDTLFLINLSPKTVYLPVSATSLKEVEIQSAKINPLVFFKDPETREFKRINTDDLRGKKNTDRAGGLRFNLGYGKYKKQEENLKAQEVRDSYEAEINRIFTEAFVNKLVKLEGEELKAFMSLYRPSALLVQSQKPFNYEYYTVQAYHKWLKLPISERKVPSVPKLKKND